MPERERNFNARSKRQDSSRDRSIKGIGRATAVARADAGARVLVHYGRSEREAGSLVTAIKSKGGRAEAISADRNARRRLAARPTGSFPRWRSFGGTRAQRRSQQSRTHRRLHRRRL